MQKQHIAVLFGGCSTEYEVSLQSAYAVLKAIDGKKYQVYPIGITKEGVWKLYQGVLEKILIDEWSRDGNCLPVMISPDRMTHGMIVLRNPIYEVISLDAALPILHGKNGEDGTVQGLLELAGIPVIGCGMVCSVSCMDKEIAHTMAEKEGIQVPKSVVLRSLEDLEVKINQVKKLRYPLFIKPAKSGSSVGITKVKKGESLFQAVEKAFCYDDKVIMEEGIDGFEVGCAVIGTKKLTIGEVDEIELSQGFFDYHEKYTLESSQIHMPARISSQEAEKIKETALHIYKVLGCKGFARVDLFYTSDKKIVFNEVNTIPGFTAHSRFPNMFKGIGITFDGLVNEIIRLGLVES